MEDIAPKFTIGDFFAYVLAYLCWLIAAAVGMLTLLVIRNTLNFVWPMLGGSRWVLRPIDRFGLVIMGLIWLIYVIFVEQDFRTAITLARERRSRERPGSPTPARPQYEPQGRFMRFMRKLNLDILVRRFIPTIITPLVLLAVVFLLQELVTMMVTG
jgi:hypothetical protein